MLQIENLSRVYGRASKQIVAVDRVTFSVPRGQRLAILGRSGSGKSTLLNLIAGLDRPSSGTLTVHGRRLDQMGKNELARYRCQDVGVIFQSFQLMPHFSAFKNVELPLVVSGVASGERKTRTLEALNNVGLADRSDHLPNALSGGEQQRVAIARALVHRPALLVADEPTGNLDSATAQRIEDLMLELWQATETTFVLVTHDEDLADRFAQRVIRMSDGQVVEDRTTDSCIHQAAPGAGA